MNISPPKIWTFFFNNTKSDMIKIDKDEYRKMFIVGRSRKDIRRTYEKAWESKNFEIGNYWKRANYFWAFQVASF
ncbi:MAG: hypothetical protein IIB07_07150, partial [Bacteroidetes bacterium]|nr:hypothetical protein [Bacteroidota bacterium]